MSTIAITWAELLRVGQNLGAFYGLIIGVVILAYLVSRPAPSVGIIGGAFTALSLIAFGVGPALVVATVTALCVALMVGIVTYLPRRINQANELANWQEFH